MDPLFAAGTALAVSLAVIPLMIRLAPRLRLLDEPNARKVHAQPIPRVGGWGIAVGALAAIVLWLPLGPTPVAFCVGGLVLLVAGAADDMHELPGKIKLLLQFIAIFPVIVAADLVIDVIPLFRDIHLPYVPAVLLTGLGLITCINATNTSDGLDGLAAGATLLSLFGILYLAFRIEGFQILLMTAAALGGLIGFLRYNTHPAVIFMGDLGSQFLGYVVGFLALALWSKEPDAITPWALLLLLGLPTADIVVVAVRRLMNGVSVFRADKTHIHHRFLDLGFTHTQSVVTFYTLQGSFVFFGVALQGSDTWKIFMVYALHFAVIYGFLHLAERTLAEKQAWRPNANIAGKADMEPSQALLWIPRVALETILPLLLVTAPIVVTRVPPDFGILGLLLLVVLVVRLFNERLRKTSLTRIPVFLVATAVVYLYTNYRPFESSLAWLVEFAVIFTMAAMAFVAVRFSPKRRKEEFRTTAMDYLLVVFALLAIVALRTTPAAFNAWFLIYLPVVLYSCEILVIERRQRTSWLPPAALAAAAVLVVRGLLIGGSLASLAWYLKRIRVMDAREILHRGLQQLDLWSLRCRYYLGTGVTCTNARRSRYAFCTATERRLPVLPFNEYALRREASAVLDGKLYLAGHTWRWTDRTDIWRSAPDTGRIWPNTFFGSIDYREANPFGDIRKLWEPSRLQHLVDLALVGDIGIDKDRDQAARQVAAQLISWDRNNPPLEGPHYISAMECALRIIAVCHASDLLRNDISDDEPWEALLSIVGSHAPLIERRLSLHSSKGNHTVAEAAGLVYAGLLFPEMNHARRWADKGMSILAEAATSQVLPDGGGAEQTTCYHHFNLQLFHLVHSLAIHCGYPAATDVEEAIERGRRFLEGLGLSTGWLPPIGDGDGGYALSQYLELPAGAEVPQPVSTFSDSGYTIVRTGESPETILIFDHGPLGMPPAYGHGHADALSLQMRMGAEDLLLDTGTYTYTGDQRWRAYFRGTPAHNTVTVDGGDQARQETCFMWSRPFSAWLVAADIEQCSSGRMVAEHDGYRHSGVRHLRGVAWHRDQWLVVRDILSGQGAHRLDLHWHLGLEPYRHDDRTFIMKTASGPVTIRCDGGTISAVRGGHAPGIGWRSAAYGMRETIPTVRVSHEGPLPHTFTTLIRMPGCTSPDGAVEDALQWLAARDPTTGAPTAVTPPTAVNK